MDDNTKPHGSDVFNVNWNCHCDKCEPQRNAVNRLVASFSQVPRRWIDHLQSYVALDAQIRLPMWGTFFIPTDSAHVSNIEKLCRDIEVDDEDYEAFASAGWQEVGDTGIYAIRFADELLLGIDGKGYDFCSHHWSRLYDALGYQWHKH